MMVWSHTIIEGYPSMFFPALLWANTGYSYGVIIMDLRYQCNKIFTFYDKLKANSPTNLNRSNCCAPPSLPCAKGGGTAQAVTEGSCGRYLFCCKASAKPYCGNNPSVKNQKIFDSSLCTREPFPNGYTLQKTAL